MGQFQSPYTPPTFSITYTPMPQQQLMAAPRRAGTLMLVLGSLILMMGACSVISAIVVTGQQLAEQQQELHELFGDLVKTLPPPDQIRHSNISFGTATAVLGFVLVALGTAVRRGSRAATGIALGITALMLAVCAIIAMALLLAGLVEPALLLFAILPGVPLALFGWQLTWLIGASRATFSLMDAQRRQAAEYWQTQQNMAAYAGPSSGYGYSSPAPPPSKPDA